MKKENFTALGISDELAEKATAASTKELEAYTAKGKYDTFTAANLKNAITFEWITATDHEAITGTEYTA